MKLEIYYGKKNGKSTNAWRLKNMLLKNHWVNEEIKEEVRKYLKTNENGNTNFPISMGCRKSSSKREVYVIQAYLKKQKSQINDPTFQLKELEKEKQSPKSAEERK